MVRTVITEKVPSDHSFLYTYCAHWFFLTTFFFHNGKHGWKTMFPNNLLFSGLASTQQWRIFSWGSVSRQRRLVCSIGEYVGEILPTFHRYMLHLLFGEKNDQHLWYLVHPFPLHSQVFRYTKSKPVTKVNLVWHGDYFHGQNIKLNVVNVRSANEPPTI